MLNLNKTSNVILQQLLDQHEQPERQRVNRVQIKAAKFSRYFDEKQVDERQQTNNYLIELAKNQLIKLHWRKWEEGNWLEAVDLLDAVVLYRLLKRQPLAEQQQALRELLAEYISAQGWMADWLAWLEQQLIQQRSIQPLDLTDPAWNRDLLRAIDGLTQLETPILERLFSVGWLGQSKRFSELESAVLRVLRQFAPQAKQFGDDDRALLQAFNLEKVPEYVLLAGDLDLELHGNRLELGAFRPSLGLPSSILRQAQVLDSTGTEIITIENLTSFHSMLARQPQALLIYTGGFASPSLCQFLGKLAIALPDVAWYHWGDYDVGGLRILAHLRQHVAQIRLWQPDPVIFQRVANATQALTQKERQSLAELQQHRLLHDCQALITAMLEQNIKLEQEQLDLLGH
ncbi:Wadjet anti-phage system protein JetD domain-containing protein [Herpetosiphon gulosus]|uniref:Wadjet protein JetD C-terminal domain-containing protein n=1 Tax=Herpetosiphon gulosus TaxID=1973496 RepID=A0ABP9X504_9CHLR